MLISLWRCTVLLTPLWLLACAHADSGRLPEPSQRVVLTTAKEWPHVSEVINRAAALAGVPMREGMELAPRRYRATLICADPPACREAMQRIAVDRSFVLAVEADGRQQLPSKPGRDTAR